MFVSILPSLDIKKTIPPSELSTAIISYLIDQDICGIHRGQTDPHDQFSAVKRKDDKRSKSTGYNDTGLGHIRVSYFHLYTIVLNVLLFASRLFLISRLHIVKHILKYLLPWCKIAYIWVSIPNLHLPSHQPTSLHKNLK